jgi:acid phosphatase
MTRLPRRTPLAAALASAFTLVLAPSAYAGVVVGHGYYQHARVCIDSNDNGRCDAGEQTTYSAADGSFSLSVNGPLTAEVGYDARLYDPSTGTTTPVETPLVLRASYGATIVGPISTEVVSLSESSRDTLPKAAKVVAQRVGVTKKQILEDPNAELDAGVRALLFTETDGLVGRIGESVKAAGATGDLPGELDNRLDLEGIDTVVVIYDENRSFNNVFNGFPGAESIYSNKTRRQPLAPQRDRDGSVLPVLPPAWGGLTAAGQSVVVTQAMTTNVWANAPFQIDSQTPAWGQPLVDQAVVTRDLYHRFFENQMQIGDGANDNFVAWADSGGLTMGYWNGPATAMWDLASQYTLADHFFQGAFGGSFLNHQYLICACAPEYPDADTSPAHPTIAVVDKDGGGHYTHNLTVAANSPASALDGPPSFTLSGNIAPGNYFNDGTFRAVNTMQPPYQPSGNAPAGNDPTGEYADPLASTTLPMQTQATIGDLLTAKGIAFKWYAGGWDAAQADRSNVYKPNTGNFQAHHQPFNYFADFDPVQHADARSAHLQDYDDLLADAASGTLPPVSFYKPIGVNNEHPGYASLAAGDAHVASVIQALQASPQWKHMLVVVTYDEFGGQWDEVTPPKGDLVGPGSRIPAVIVSAHAKKKFVDHTVYDTASVLRFITHRFSLPVLDGLKARDNALMANGDAPMGDLTNALQVHASAK